MEQQETRRALRAWIIARGNAAEGDLRDDSALVSDGIINSLDIFELITHLDALRGKPIDTQTLKGDEFRSINSLMDSFFGDAP